MTPTNQSADVPRRTPNPASDFEWSENTSGVTIRKFLKAVATEVVIPEEIAGRPVTRIGKRAFVRSMLRAVTIAKSITKIGQDAFRDCAALQTVMLGDGSVSVCRRAFARCQSLQTVVFNDGLQNIADEAFTGCGALKSVAFPDSL